jgi:drug/metabolite transporter (DMT)-like permease
MADTQRIKAYMALLTAPLLWGGALVAGRIVSAGVPPISAAFIRFVMTSFLLALVVRIKEGYFPRPKREAVPALVLAGLSGVALFNIFLFSGLALVSAGRSAVIIAMTPAMVALVSALLYKERQSILFPVALLLAFAGAVVVITEGNIASILRSPPGLGDLFMLGCVASWTVYSFAGRRAVQDVAPLTAIFYTSMIGAAALALPALLEGGIPVLFASPAIVWGNLLYMSIGAAGFAHVFYYIGIREVGADRSAIFMNLEPISALLLGLLLLGEAISLPLAVGSIMVLGGVSLATKSPAPASARNRSGTDA